MSERVLSLRELNRATLARQLLLARHAMPAMAAIERLCGMQSQLPQPPFVGLWSRLDGFERAELVQHYHDRTAVRATLMRVTLHLVSAADYLRFRHTLQPVLDAAGANIIKQRGGIDAPAVLEAGHAFLAEEPRTFAEISRMLESRWPDVDVGSMRYTIRTTLPLVQLPEQAPWVFPSTPRFTLAEPWLGTEIGHADEREAFVLRYLAGFGPASVRDMQTWSGLANLQEVFERLRPQLQTYRDEKKRELFDLPGLEIPNAETPAPVRFLPEFDNLLIGHQDRRRVVPDAVRKGVYLPGLRVAATILVDGIVSGAWKVERAKQAAELVITPFRALEPAERDALAAEAEPLLRFIEPAAKTTAIRFAEPP